jgi:hypothetical protein
MLSIVRDVGICLEQGAFRTGYAIGALILAAIVAIPNPAFSQPPTSITECGSITKPGLYELDSVVVASSPSSGDCIVITAPNVSLNLNRYNVMGATASVGIHVMKSASGTFIEGNGSTIQAFGEGIQIDAPNVGADNFSVISNTDAGVLLNKVAQADLSNFYAAENKNDGVRIAGGSYNVLQMPVISGNGRFGVWVESSSHNSVGNFDINNNPLAGVYIGCSQAGPRSLCSRGAKSSNYNNLFSGTVGIYSSGEQQYGIAIDQGDSFNRVVNVRAWQDNEVDLLDVNSDCGTNFWFAEPILGLVEPSACIN